MPKDYEPLTIIAIAAILTSILLPGLSRARYISKFKEAYSYAVHDVGDKQTPLSDLERKTWYESMQVEKGKEPEKKILQNYINSCIERKIAPNEEERIRPFTID